MKPEDSGELISKANNETKEKKSKKAHDLWRGILSAYYFI